MSWTPGMTKETYQDVEFRIKVLRVKTGKKIYIAFCGEEEPFHIISKVKLDPNELLILENKQYTVLFSNFYETGLGTSTWDYKPYEAHAIEVANKVYEKLFER